MKRRSERQTKRVFVFRLSQVNVGQATQVAWRALVGFTERRIESAYAAKTRSDGYLAHRQGCFINQLLSEMQSPRGGNRSRRSAQVADEEPAQLTAANSQASGEGVNVFSFQGAFADQTQGARDCSRGAHPGRSSG